MIKKNKRILLITSAVILLPVLVGVFLWNDLPDTMAIHFGVDNEANGWSSKRFAVFGLPLIVLGIHWLAVIATSADPKRSNINIKMLTVLFWICPSVCLLCSVVTYAVALGIRVDIGFIIIAFMGILLIVLGNYLSKCKQNYSLGLRLPWTLNDSDNWYHTHRIASWSMILGGAVIFITAFLRSPWLFFSVLFFSISVPVFYSYLFYKKQKVK